MNTETTNVIPYLSLLHLSLYLSLFTCLSSPVSLHLSLLYLSSLYLSLIHLSLLTCLLFTCLFFTCLPFTCLFFTCLSSPVSP